MLKFILTQMQMQVIGMRPKKTTKNLPKISEGFLQDDVVGRFASAEPKFFVAPARRPCEFSRPLKLGALLGAPPSEDGGADARRAGKLYT